MELNLDREKINYAENVLNTTIRQEESMEMIVPDALPDILRIVDTDANVFVRGKDTDNGRVTVSGVVAATVIYAPEGASGLRRVSLDIPFSATAAESAITPNSRVTARVALASADAVAVNPRKLVARAELFADVACYNDAELDVPTGVSDAGELGLELQNAELDVNLATDVREKTFVVTDELTLPSSAPPVAELLKTSVTLTPEDAKQVGSKLIFKGTAHVAILYSPPGGVDVNVAELATEFSQILELAGNSEESEFDIIPLLTGAYFDVSDTQGGDGRVIQAEIHAVAQCVTAERRRIPYISDAYSTGFALESRSEPAVFENRTGNQKCGGVLRASLDAPTDVARVISVNARAGAPSAEARDGVVAVKCPLYVTAMYMSGDGRVMSANGRFETEANGSNAAEGRVYLPRAECGRELYAVPAENGIELRVPVDFTVAETEKRRAAPIVELNCDEDAPLDLSDAPSLVLSFAGNGDTLWSLAKRHRSTAALILEANGALDEESVGDGRMLIIPKKR